MKFVVKARASDWHVRPKHRGRGVWACGKTMGEALRTMARHAMTNGCAFAKMEVEIANDNITSRAIEAPRLVTMTDVRERVLDADEPFHYYFIRDIWTDDLLFISKCRVGFHPYWGIEGHGRPEPCTREQYEEMDAWGFENTGYLPHKWHGPVPRLALL